MWSNPTYSTQYIRLHGLFAIVNINNTLYAYSSNCVYNLFNFILISFISSKSRVREYEDTKLTYKLTTLSVVLNAKTYSFYLSFIDDKRTSWSLCICHFLFFFFFSNFEEISSVRDAFQVICKSKKISFYVTCIWTRVNRTLKRWFFLFQNVNYLFYWLRT